MLNKLINMAKNGMFDTAFLLAEKHNLENQLFDNLRKNHDISLDDLKYLIDVPTYLGKYYPLLDICYNLTFLRIMKEYIFDFDFTDKTKLEKSIIEYCGLSNIDTTNIKSLSLLNCKGNSLSSLNTENNINLEILSIPNNPIYKLDLTNNKKLKHLDISNTCIDYIDLSHNLELERITYFELNSLKKVILNKKVEKNIHIIGNENIVEYVE